MKAWLFKQILVVGLGAALAPKLAPGKQSSSIVQRSQGANQEITQLLKHYGTFTLDPASAAAAQASLNDMLRRLKPASFGEFEVVFINGNIPNAMIFNQDDASNGSVVVFKGLIDLADNDHQIAGVLAHEVAHALTFATLKGQSRSLQMSREELFTADHNALELMLNAGFDPREYRRFLVKLASRPKNEKLDAMDVMLGSHPPDAFRIAAVDKWLGENETRLPPRGARSLDPALRLVQKSRGVNPAVPAAEKKVREPVVKYEKPQTFTYPEFVAEMKKHGSENLSFDDQLKLLEIFRGIPSERQEMVNAIFKGRVVFNRGIDIQDFFSDQSGFHVFLRTAAELGQRQSSVADKLKVFRSMEKVWEDGTGLPRLDNILLGYQDQITPRLRNFSLPEILQELRTPHILQSRAQLTRSLFEALAHENKPEILVKTFEAFRNLNTYDFGSEAAKLFENPAWGVVSAVIDHNAGKSILPINRANWPHSSLGRGQYDALRRATTDPRLTPAQKFIVDHSNFLRQFDEIISREVPTVDALIAAKDEVKRRGYRWDQYSTDDPLFFQKELRGAVTRHFAPKLTVADALRITSDNDFWREDTEVSRKYKGQVDKVISGSTQPVVDAAKENAEAVGETWPAQESLKPRNMGLLGPAYDSASADYFQSALWEGVHKSGNAPATPEAQHQLLLALSKRSANKTTDGWAEKLYLDEHFNCADCLRQVLQARAISDVNLRKKIYFRMEELAPTNRELGSTNRLAKLVFNIHRINDYFPEESLARLDVLEDYANRAKTNHAETKIIELAKLSENKNGEALALRLFSGIYHQVKTVGQLSSEERQFNFIRYLAGKGEVHSEISYSLQHFNLPGLMAQYQILPPHLKAAVIAPFLAPPDGLLGSKRYQNRIVDMITSDTTGYAKESKLLLKSAIFALEKTEPEQVGPMLSFIIGQSNKSASGPGERLKALLQSLGGTGVSIGQKLYQRGMLPDEFLTHIEDLQDAARKPARIKIYEMISRALEVPNVDTILNIDEILGDASSKVVVKVRYTDGRIGKLDARALKVLWPNFDRTNELEAEKLGFMSDYLIKEGGPSYRKLRSVLNAVQRGLRRQADVRVEMPLAAQVKRLYKSGEIDPASGFRWHVVQADPRAGSGRTFVNDEVAEGISLKKLKLEFHRPVFAAIYDREAEILLGAPEPASQRIVFESDRHKGNFKVKLNRLDPKSGSHAEPELTVYDYALVSDISVGQRNALFKLIGFLEHSRTQGFVDRPVLRDIIVLVDEHFATEKGRSFGLMGSLGKNLNRSFAEKKSSIGTSLFDLFGAFEKQGYEIEPNIYDYVTALGNLEYYSRFKGEAGAPNVMRERLATLIREQFKDYSPHITALDRCAGIWARIRLFSRSP